MKALILALAIVLLVPFVGCDRLTIEDQEVTKLKAELKKANEKVKQLEAANTRLQEEKEIAVAEKNALIDENQTLKEEIAALKNSSKPEDLRKTFTIKFDSGKLYNKPDSREVAKVVVGLIKDHGPDKVRVTVKGYSSHDGDKDYNLFLSKERAEGVMHKIYEAYNNGPLHIDLVAFGEGSDDERKVVVEVEIFK